MGKEAKIGVGVVLGLLVVLGGVVGVRVASLGSDGDSDVAAQESAAGGEQAPVTVQPGVAVSASSPPKVIAPPKPSTPPPSVEKPATAKKPAAAPPEYPEPPASGAAQWRQLAIQDANAGAAEAGSGLANAPPAQPSPHDPANRYGFASAPPPPPDVAVSDASAGYATAGQSPHGGVQSFDPAGRGRYGDASSANSYGHAGPSAYGAPAGQAGYGYASRQDMGGAYAASPSRAVGGTAYADPGAGRRGDGSYEVQPNDSFWTISEKLYGTGAYFKALAEYNAGKVANQHQLQVGQMIAAPDVAELERKHSALCPKPEHRYVPRPQTVALVGQHAGGKAYTVAEGDSLYRIARHELGDASRWHEIYALNRDVIGQSFNHLRPGTQLVLPNTPQADPADTLTRRPSSLY